MPTATLATPGATTADPVGRALDAVSRGQPVVLIDDVGHGDGELLVAAELVTPATMAFLVRHTSGFVRVALPAAECDRLRLPPMYPFPTSGRTAAHAVTVDAADGVSTGISARDRARTIRLLADPRTEPDDLVRPGHVVPLRVADGGVLRQPEPAQAAVNLTLLAGLQPGAALSGIVSARYTGCMAEAPELRAFAAEHGLAVIEVGDVVGRFGSGPGGEGAACPGVVSPPP